MSPKEGTRQRREPLRVEVVVRDPDVGETVREVVSNHPSEGSSKTREFQRMLDDANERALQTIERIYEQRTAEEQRRAGRAFNDEGGR